MICTSRITRLCQSGIYCDAFRESCRYWNDEEQTRSVMKTDANGTLWMHTGDEGIMDEEGYLRGKLICIPCPHSIVWLKGYFHPIKLLGE